MVGCFFPQRNPFYDKHCTGQPHYDEPDIGGVKIPGHPLLRKIFVDVYGQKAADEENPGPPDQQLKLSVSEDGDLFCQGCIRAILISLVSTGG